MMMFKTMVFLATLYKAEASAKLGRQGTIQIGHRAARRAGATEAHGEEDKKPPEGTRALWEDFVFMLAFGGLDFGFNWYQQQYAEELVGMECALRGAEAKANSQKLEVLTAALGKQGIVFPELDGGLCVDGESDVVAGPEKTGFMGGTLQKKGWWEEGELPEDMKMPQYANEATCHSANHKWVVPLNIAADGEDPKNVYAPTKFNFQQCQTTLNYETPAHWAGLYQFGLLLGGMLAYELVDLYYVKCRGCEPSELQKLILSEWWYDEKWHDSKPEREDSVLSHDSEDESRLREHSMVVRQDGPLVRVLKA